MISQLFDTFSANTVNLYSKPLHYTLHHTPLHHIPLHHTYTVAEFIKSLDLGL